MGTILMIYLWRFSPQEFTSFLKKEREKKKNNRTMLQRKKIQHQKNE